MPEYCKFDDVRKKVEFARASIEGTIGDKRSAVDRLVEAVYCLGDVVAEEEEKKKFLWELKDSISGLILGEEKKVLDMLIKFTIPELEELGE